MRFLQLLCILVVSLLVCSCESTQPPSQKIISPTETLRTFSDAAKSKDLETVKRLMTRESLEQRIAYAENLKISVDELLGKDDGIPFKNLPEIRNEDVRDNNASIEVKHPFLQTWNKLLFIKQENIWKIDLITYSKTLKQELMDILISPESNSSKTKK